MVILNKNVAVNVLPNTQALYQTMADSFYRYVTDTLNSQEKISIVLSGGQTPQYFFDVLANSEFYQQQIPWSRLQFFFADERFVPVADQRNNYRMAKQHLFAKVAVLPENIHRMPTEYNTAQAAAEAYQEILQSVFQLKANAKPLFDLVLLGLGDNAHTASLMPRTSVLSNDTQLVAAVYYSLDNTYRITLTPATLNHAKRIIFLVAGKNKAKAVQHVLQGPRDPVDYPAQLIQNSSGQIIWYMDKDAAALLPQV
jgi:6-phosphogluconolactonase